MAKVMGSVGPRVGPIVAALGYGEAGEEVLRAANALALEAGAGLVCATIDTGAAQTAEEGERMASNLRLARSLGASVESEPDADAAAGLLRQAAGLGASSLVVGAGARASASAGGRARAGWRWPFRRGVAERLASSPRGFALVTIAPPRQASAASRALGAVGGGTAAQYLAALLMVAAVTAVNLLLAEYAGYLAAAIPYLAAISLAALALDRWPVLFAALLSAAAWDYLFIPPRFTMRISREEDVIVLGLYFLAALYSGWMTSKLRSSQRLLAARERRLSRLSALAQALAGAGSLGSILEKSVEAIKEAFGAEAIVILRDEDGHLKRQAESGWEPLDASAREAARVSFEELKGAGRFTKLSPASEWHFVPLEGPGACLGVLGLRLAHDASWSEEAESFCRTMAFSISTAIAREAA